MVDIHSVSCHAAPFHLLTHCAKYEQLNNVTTNTYNKHLHVNLALVVAQLFQAQKG